MGLLNKDTNNEDKQEAHKISGRLSESTPGSAAPSKDSGNVDIVVNNDSVNPEPLHVHHFSDEVDPSDKCIVLFLHITHLSN